MYFGLHSSPFILSACIENLLEKFRATHPLTTRVLEDGIYVDDFAAGASDVQEAKKICSEAREILGAGAFNLRKWSANSDELRGWFKEKNIDLEQHQEDSRRTQMVLGLVYDTGRDTLSLNIKTRAEGQQKPASKRSLLKSVAEIFDPAGWMEPVTVVGKMLLQKLWFQKLDWDEAAPDHAQIDIQKWERECQKLKDVAISRRYAAATRGDALKSTLHIFSDASSEAYGAAAYITTIGDGEPESALIMSKSRACSRNSASSRNAWSSGLIRRWRTTS